MEEIKFIGLSEIEDVDQEMIKKIVAEYYPKIKRLLHNDVSMVVHLKPYTKGGARPKYSLHVRALAPTRIFESSKVAEWDLSTAMRRSMEDIEKEIHHAFHEDDGTKRPRHELV